MDFRIGQGFDVHRLVAGRKLILGGVEVPYELGLLGHSDADVALHALMDALLGALALGDIGEHFPDSAAEYKDVDSRKLLEKVLSLDEVKCWQIVNIDLTITAQRPKLAPFREEMRREIARICGVGADRVSVKFTTTEKLGFTGRGEGIAANCAVLLKSE